MCTFVLLGLVRNFVHLFVCRRGRAKIFIFITHDDVPVECDGLCARVANCDTKSRRQNGERRSARASEDDVRASDCCGLLRGPVAQDPVPAGGGQLGRPAQAQQTRPGRR